jgi:hypothetical protein
MSGRRVIVPVDLGGSTHRCVVAPPPIQPPNAGVVRALIAHYRTERLRPADNLEVGFYRGGVPGKSLLDVCEGLPIRVGLHPADLNRAAAKHLFDSGVRTIEVEALSFDPHVLRTVGRNYTTRRVFGMLHSLREMGFSVGVHLVPGLPGTDESGAINDVNAVLQTPEPIVDFVRIWPAIAFEGSGLARWAAEGRWHPWSVSEAVDVIRRMMDRFDAAGVPVIRVGLQPGQDVPSRAVAGPVHPNLRGEVETLRFQARMEQALVGVNVGQRVVIRVNPKDLGWAKGTSNSNARTLRNRLGLAEVAIEPDKRVERGAVKRGRVR